MHPELIAALERGFACQERGDLAGAEVKYLKVLEQDEHNEFALNLMGVVCNRRSEPDKAIHYLLRALAVNDRDPETYNNLGLAHKELKKFPEAREAFERSLELNPRQAAALNNLANVLAATDMHDDAIRYFKAALKLEPDYIDCLNNLAVSLKEVGQTDQALGIIGHAISIDESRSDSYNNKGEILLRQTRYEEARDAFESAVKLDGNLVAKINLSTALKQLGKERAAMQTLEEVLSVEEHNSEAHNHLGVLLEQMGDTKRAAKHFRLALKYTPNHASSFYQLSKLRDQRLTKSEVAEIHELLEDPQLLGIFRSSLCFALGCEYEKRKEFEKSIEYFIKAQRIKASRNPYDGSAVCSYVQAVQAIFPVDLDNSDLRENDAPTPIFVVGMPRSGTTLTEQIIASHSEITGAGEVGFINELVTRASAMTKKPFPVSMKFLGYEHLQQLRQAYFGRMIDRFGSNRFFADKNPLNFNMLGAIATIFPEARILYCKRNPMDNCVSIFKLPFDDNQGYSHDLAALGHYYRQHEKLMNYWLACYPKQILTVRYEETVEDLERQARRMLDFIGVDFEEQVLRFFENNRIVMTPSTQQVRQSIYRTSVNAWQKYGHALDTLINALTINEESK